ncbi:hypothetical protein WJM97_15060 [Okeanomitos corallinicola TIOX110]|uniref:Uncharacterized protein n=1 Tax=Okeanomitos corallinicola TIOX110 TaxID=3133117 RepID=A0ABZ2UNZ2_9CYAN
MPQNSDFQEKKSENQAISYRNRLNSWTIARLVAQQKRIIVARFRTRSDADGYIQHLRQQAPQDAFEIFFDSQSKEATI